ncbi:SET domain containing protein, putative [Trypanosoma equiperdum]|uniref:SET domain containing protein, putative n=1 Tax=Trypanosoma equiperdum TaxID=5694 RepID=A0A1G4I206_TRYEQ|nr:SET domain containing protein, putative [Trypanosoma equiperdum]
MVRLRSAWVAQQSSRELNTYLRQRAWHFASCGNHAIAADYVIRLLNRHPRDATMLLLGEVTARRTRQKQLEAKCRQSHERLCTCMNVNNALSLVEDERKRETLKEWLQEPPPADDVELEEHIIVSEQEPLPETQAAVEVMAQRVSAKPLVGLQFPKQSIYGRGIYALTRVPSGTAVLADQPFVVQRMNSTTCAHCLSSITSASSTSSAAGVVCPHCGQESYCSISCRDAAWREYHSCCCHATNKMYASWESSMQELFSTDVPEESRAALCCLAVAKICAMATVQQQHPLSLPRLRSLRGRATYDAATALSEVGALAVTLAQSLHQQHLYMEEILSLFALVQTNEFLLSGGMALYHGYSFLNHSCEPNCGFVGTNAMNRRLVVLRDIREGEQLLINYNADLTTCVSYEDRRALCKQRYFECFCPKCIRRE